MARKKPALSELENRVMQIIWQRGTATAEDVREALKKEYPLKDSTIRTVLRRLEEKGYAKHSSRGRTYVYSPTVPSQNVASDAVSGIIEKFCDGSVENLLIGMVDNKLLTPAKLLTCMLPDDGTDIELMHLLKDELNITRGRRRCQRG